MRSIGGIVQLVFIGGIAWGQGFDPSQIAANGFVRGAVVDSATGAPLPYATVSLLRAHDGAVVTGGVAGDDGKIVIRNVPAGRYSAVVEFIGYEPKRVGSIDLFPRGGAMDQDLGTVRLREKGVTLEPIEVEAEAPIYTTSADKKVFRIENNPTVSGGSALDALKQVPGVDVDFDGTVSLRGSANVKILIDGRPSSMLGGDRKGVLESLPANSLKDIEVITNPSAKYDPDGMAGIINLVTRGNALNGTSGVAALGGGTRGRYNISGQLNHRFGAISLFGNAALRFDNRHRHGDNFREYFLIDQALDQVTEGDRAGGNLFTKFGVEWNASPHQTASLTVGNNTGDQDEDEEVESMKWWTQEIPGDVHLAETTLRSSRGTERRNGYDVTLSYNYQFPDPKHTFMATATHSSSGSTDSTLYSSESEDMEMGLRRPENRVTTVQADYSRPFGTWKLETGFKSSAQSADDDLQYSLWDNSQSIWKTDTLRTNRLVFDESIHAGYVQIGKNGGLWSWTAGIRAEKADTESKLVTTGESFLNPYTSFFPSASISFGVAPVFQAQLSYSRRINRPNTWQLNPFPKYTDDQNLRMGNPFLKPEYVDVLELGLSRFQWGIVFAGNVYYRRTDDRISHFKRLREDGVSVVTFENYDEAETFGTEVTISGKVLPRVRLTASGNLFQDLISAGDLFESNYDKTSTGFSGRGNVTWTVNPATEVIVSGFGRTPTDVPFGRMSGIMAADLSVRRKVGEALSLTFRLSDPFNTMRFRFETEDAVHRQESSRKWESRVAMLSLDYRFGKAEERPRGRRDRQRGMEEQMPEIGIE